MITLDEVNELFAVASDAEQEGKHEVARKLRDEAWTRLGMEPSDDPAMEIGRMRTAILEAGCRGVLARGYRPDDCRIDHYPNGTRSLVVTTHYSSPETYGIHRLVLEIRDANSTELGQPVMGFTWHGPWWPEWKIDPSKSEAWLAEWLHRARELAQL